MLLSPSQKDALSELVNIGFGRAAASLSALVRHRIHLQAPEVSVHLLQELQDHLTFAQPEVATVHQIFSGQLSGDAMLMLDLPGALNLIDLVSGEPSTARARAQYFTASDREALMEIGNILLNAFVGSFGNLLNVHVSFAVPRLRIEAINDFLSTLEIGQNEIRYVLLVQTRFLILDAQVEGFVSLVMGIESLDKLFEAMEKAGYQI